MSKTKVNDVEERAKILLDEANQLFNRLEASILYLGGRTTSFFGIIVSMVSFQITLIVILSGIRCFVNYSYLLLSVYLVFAVISGALSVYLHRVFDYADVEMFNKVRFERLSTCTTKDLLSDLLFFTRKAYEHNYELYNHNIKLLKLLYLSFLLCNVFFTLLIMSLWI